LFAPFLSDESLFFSNSGVSGALVIDFCKIAPKLAKSL